MLAEIKIYVESVILNWITGFYFITGLPQVFSFIAPSYTARATAWLGSSVSTEDKRQSLYRILFVLGILVAGFVSWDQQYHRAQSQTSEADPRDPTPKESTLIRDLAIKGFYKVKLYCLTGEPNSCHMPKNGGEY